MARDRDIRRVRRGVYALLQDASKIDKKERKGTLGPELKAEIRDLTNLTDLTEGSDRSDCQEAGLEIPEFPRRVVQ
jgi:hypothetical protein